MQVTMKLGILRLTAPDLQEIRPNSLTVYTLSTLGYLRSRSTQSGLTWLMVGQLLALQREFN